MVRPSTIVVTFKFQEVGSPGLHAEAQLCF